MRRIFVFMTCAVFELQTFGQATVHKVEVKRAFVFDPVQAQESFNPSLEPDEVKHNPMFEKEELIKLKLEQSKRFPRKVAAKSAMRQGAEDLITLRSFSVDKKSTSGNMVPHEGGGPMDNHMAISDGGKILLGWNTRFYGYDLDPDTSLLYTSKYNNTWSFSKFGSKFGVSTSDPFDPKVRYDPIRDRFILTFCSGRGPANSKLVVGFSSTNNPADPWYAYAIPGNPRDTTHWSDYPAITLTENEMFYTINLVEQGVSWQKGFRGSLIWQINLDAGFRGDSVLKMQYWDDIKYGGKYIRNLCPVKGALGPLGPNMYFLSNRNMDALNDSIFLVEITDTIGASSTELKVSFGRTDQAYGMPPFARQASSDLEEDSTYGLQTNDSRWLGAFLAGNTIQFVGNTIDTSTGNAAIYHGFVENVTTSPTYRGGIVGDQNWDLGYPNIAFTGTEVSEMQCIIGFDYTSPQDNPGIGAVYFNNDEQYSEFAVVKAAEGMVDMISGKYERWGDYFGLQRKFNEPGVVWANGMYGGPTNRSRTWVAELASPDASLIGVEKLNSDPMEMISYPNPTNDQFTLDFKMEDERVISVQLFGLDGKLIHDFGQTKSHQGKNRFSFSTSPLRLGQYVVKVFAGNKVLATKKLTKM